MQRAFFVTGTDTGVGKTLVSATLLHGFARQGLTVVGMKPVAAGATAQDGEIYWEDVAQLQAASNINAPLAIRNPYRFVAPIAPHIAASQCGERIELAVIKHAFSSLQKLAELVIVEGAGGLYTPLNDTATMLDLAQQLALPVILVVAMRLGCINHALLTERALISNGLQLAGWVANQVQPPMLAMAENLAALQQRLTAPLLGILPYQINPTAAAALLHLHIERL